MIRARVMQARQIQQERFAKERGKLYVNGAMQAGQIRRFCGVNGEAKELLRSALPLRGYPAAWPLSARLRPDPLGTTSLTGCKRGGVPERKENWRRVKNYRSRAWVSNRKLSRRPDR